MICPEVWKFSPPDTCNKVTTGNIQRKEFETPSPLTNFYFNHVVSVVLPKTAELQNIIKSLSYDFEYYKANKVALSDLCTEQFINSFIKTGSLTALSANSRIDTDNSVCITPEGVLVLSVNKKSYQELGLEGKVSQFSNNRKDKYIIHLNLKDDRFISNKAQHKRIIQCLKDRLQKFNLIISWEPPNKDICPSSIAKYLKRLRCKIQLCTPKFNIRTSSEVRMPIISKENDIVSSEEIVEWLGMFSIDADINSGSYDSYTNSYECPENNVIVNNVAYLEWTGFFTVHQIQRLYNSLITNLSSFEKAPWISLYVQGFSDSPVNWKLQEHQYFTNGDSGYILFIQPSGSYMLYKKSCSNKKHKK